MKELTSFEGLQCANCTTPLEGEYCHHCGQSVHSVLRPVHGLMEEFLETFLHIDGRIFHTLPPLMFKPGFLTLEYFSGRRVRYIAPFRLMFVMCLLSLFVIHIDTDLITSRSAEQRQQKLLIGQSGSFADDTDTSDVQRDLNKKLAILEAARADNTGPTGNATIVSQIDATEQKYRDEAKQRLIDLGKSPAAAASTASAPVQASEHEDGYSKATGPVHIGWLPDFANERLTLLRIHMVENIKALSSGSLSSRREAQERLITNLFGALPGIMLVLIPVFALVLAVFYLFRRRLYMEHLIVALHSHAFIFASLLLFALAGMLQTWLTPHAHWVIYVLGTIQVALTVWIPIYLLIMQKRVYRQGWPMTIVKYGFVGWIYTWLFGFALAAAGILGLAH
ncbi:DUF3667 domain-containing protein [Dyella dinghuensis]|uniref:DUF3667 domain-containing protein n=1 Tax=Dyella dinghuensis TaxID=1920169 RepID=A0A432LTQ2_9GAMM|nr:DUF3667 domain-containing protein [Dyella dinghuensis]RUL64365.1 DUF3667 domain-containing protein [Dyella dinghuensis]